MSTSCIAFVAGAAFSFKQLEEVLSEHLKDSGGDILPHIIMADYCRFIEDNIDEKWTRCFVAYLEEHFSLQEGPISDLISVSFIEHLTPRPDSINPVVKYLGKRMRQEYRKIFQR